MLPCASTVPCAICKVVLRHSHFEIDDLSHIPELAKNIATVCKCCETGRSRACWSWFHRWNRVHLSCYLRLTKLYYTKSCLTQSLSGCFLGRPVDRSTCLTQLSSQQYRLNFFARAETFQFDFVDHLHWQSPVNWYTNSFNEKVIQSYIEDLRFW